MGNTTEISHLKKLGNITFIPNGWTLTTVGQACNIKNNLRKPLSVDERKKIQGEYPYYGPTGILDYIDHYMCDGKFALIGEDGDHYLKPKEKSQTILVDGKFNVNNHAHIVEGTNICSVEWFYTYFRNRDITHMLSRQGANRYKLNKQTLEGMPILLPCLSEQKAIADTLQTWDTAIEKTQALIAAKEREFAQFRSFLFKKNKSKSYPLLEICAPITQKNTVRNTNVLTSSARLGLVSQSEYYKKDISSKNIEGYYLLNKGDFAYNRSTSEGYKFGVIKRLNKYEQGVLSTLYLCFRLKKTDFCHSDFLEHLFTSGILDAQLSLICKEGARSHGLLNVSKSDFFGIMIKLPPLAEQKAIAETLGTAQKEIDLLKKLVEKYQLQKRGLMQKLLTGQIRLQY